MVAQNIFFYVIAASLKDQGSLFHYPPVWYELWRQLNDFPLNFGQDQVAGKGEAKAPKDDKSSIEKKK